MPARTMPCPSCGEPVPPDAETCPACGEPIAADDSEPDSTAHMAGGWLPPSSVQRATSAPMPASTPAPAPAPPAAPPSNAASTPAPAPAPRVRPGDAPLFADLPFDAPASLPGWLVLIGAGLAAIAFLLPWADAYVGSFYWDTWGLSTIDRILVFVFMAVTAALAVLPNPIGAWFRSGVLGLAGGGLALGRILPYLFGSFDVPFGVLVETIGAIVLMVGGALAVAPRRPRPQPPTG